MEVVMRPVGSIKPYENNPRDNDAAVDAVAASLQAFGFRQPFVVDEADVIIEDPTAAGRVYAAYGGVYIAVALIWLWAVDGIRPSTWDYVGVAVALCGMAIIMFAPGQR